jgi:isocitrate/isopropylmalate dehydrogenase
MKKFVREKVDLLDIGIFDGKSIHEVSDKLLALRYKYNSYRTVLFEVEYVGYSGAVDIHVIVEREETDKEYQKRLKFEEDQKQQKVNQKEAKKKQELALLTRLKKKYEGKE